MNVLKKLAFVIPVALAVMVFAYMKSTQAPPERVENKERVQAVRILELSLTDVVPKVETFGYVRPDRTWQAIPEVSGKVVYMHENLKKGHFIKQGETLFQIDTTTYGLAETRGQADLMNINAKLKELDQSATNLKRLLEIEKKSMVSASQELKRKRELFRNGYVSRSDLEKEERSFLSHQTSVNNLQNSLDLIPSQKKSLLAQKKSGESSVTQKRLDVAKTMIKAPFNCRLSAVNIELNQFAAAGTVLAEAVSVDRVEISVPLSPRDFFTLLPRDYNRTIGQTPDLEIIRKAIGVTAKIQLPMDEGLNFEWDGTFSRTSESMDTKTGTLTAYVTVDRPYENAIPGKRPPLVNNMYVKVILQGQAMHDYFSIPRSALHNGSVFLCDKENRLEIRPVNSEMTLMDQVVVKEGLNPGERLVLTDLVPAIQGMKLKPVVDRQKAEQSNVQGAEKADQK
nr:hypothetical protein [uncultured Desulfobacter sp.]